MPKVYCTNPDHEVKEIGFIDSISGADMDQVWKCGKCGAEKPLRRFCVFSERAAREYKRVRDNFKLYASATLLLVIGSMILLTVIFG